MDGITSNQSTVVSQTWQSVNKKGAFNNAGVSTTDAEPTGQVRRGSSDWLAKAERDQCDSTRHPIPKSGARQLFVPAGPGDVPDWIIKACEDHGECARHDISPARQLELA